MDVTTTEANLNAALEQSLTLSSFADVDVRRTPFFKVRKLARRLARDLGDDLPTAQLEMIQRTAMLGALCEHCEVHLLRGQPVMLCGQPVTLGDYQSMAKTQRLFLVTLGLKRVPRDITDPLTYARQRERAAS